MKLYDYYRSSACYRVRIVLNLKDISFEKFSVHLLNHGGEQHLPEYLKVNPQGLVPTLDEHGHIIRQSLAIIEYLEEIAPTPSLFPSTPLGRAEVRSLALSICCDLHPLNNLRVLNQLRQQFSANEEQITTWIHHWLELGFTAFENRLKNLQHKQSSICYGNHITLADVCLIPQVFSAKRFNFSLDNYPLINEINNYCSSLPAFADAVPEK